MTVRRTFPALSLLCTLVCLCVVALPPAPVTVPAWGSSAQEGRVAGDRRATQVVSAPSPSRSAARPAVSRTRGVVAPRSVRMNEWLRLLRTPSGRTLLRTGLGSVLLANLERRYGVAATALDGTSPGARPVLPRRRIQRSRPPRATAVLAGALGRPFAGVPVTAYRTASGPANGGPGRHVLPRGGVGRVVRHADQHLWSVSLADAAVPLRVLRVRPPRAFPGTPLSFTGAGFAPGQVVTFTLRDGSGGATLLGLGGTDGVGVLVPVRLYVPNAAAPGVATIVARDKRGEQVRLSVRIAPFPGPVRRLNAPGAGARASALSLRPPPIRPATRARVNAATSTSRARRARGVSACCAPLGTRLQPPHRDRPAALGAARPTRPTPGARRVQPAGLDLRRGVNRRRWTGARPPSSPDRQVRRSGVGAAEQVADAAGYSVTVGGFLLTAPTGPASGTTTVADVTVTPPPGLAVNGPITLAEMNVDQNNQPVLPLNLPAFSFAVAGFPVTTTADSPLDEEGLHTQVELTLPAEEGHTTLQGSTVISATPLAAPIDLGATSVVYGGFPLALDDLTLTNSGLLAGRVTLTLPADILPPDATPDLTLGALGIAADGTLSTGTATTVTLPTFTVTVAGFAVTLKQVTLGLQGIAVHDAEVPLPARLLPLNAPHITLTGSLTITTPSSGTASISGYVGVDVRALDIAGFPVTVDRIRLDHSGLRITGAHLTLEPGWLPGTTSPVTLTGQLAVTPQFTVTGELETQQVSLVIAGFTLTAGHIRLDATDTERTQLLIDNAELGLQPILPSSTTPLTLTGNDLSVTRIAPAEPGGNPTYEVGGALTLSNVDINIRGHTAHVGEVRFDRKGLAVTGVTYTVPAALGGSTLHGQLTVEPTRPTWGFKGTLFVDNPHLAWEHLTVSARKIDLTVANQAPGVPGAPITTTFRVLDAQATLPAALGRKVVEGNLSVAVGAGGAVFEGQLTVRGIELSYGGFETVVDALTVDNNGIRASGVALTLPEGFGGVTLSGALTVTVGATGTVGIDGHLAYAPARRATLRFGGFTASVASMLLGSTGLTLASPELEVTPALSPLFGGRPLALTYLRINSSFNVSLASTNLHFSFAGATVDTGPLTYETGGVGTGLVAPSAAITLPAVFGASKTFRFPDLLIPGDGRVQGQETTRPLSFSIGDLQLLASGFSLANGAITVERINAALPSVFQGELTLFGLSYDGSRFNLRGGGANLTLPPINVAGFAITAQAGLTLTNQGGGWQYDFAGRGMMTLPGVGQMACAVELGSAVPNPFRLKRAELDVQIYNAGLPIDQTGLAINGLSGAIQLSGPPATPIYSVALGLGLTTVDGGFLYRGTIRASMAGDGNFGFGGRGRLLSALDIDGGFCLRLVAIQDGVCSQVLPQNGQRIDAGRGTGLYAEIRFTASVTLRKTIRLTAAADARLWRDSGGPQIAAAAALDLHVPEGSIFWWLPWSDTRLSARATLGTFRNGRTLYRGLKFTALGRAIFVDTNLGIHLSGNDYQQLVDEGSGGQARVLTRLPTGGVQIQTLHLPLTAAGTSRRPMRPSIAPHSAATYVLLQLPSSRDTYITFAWRKGAPQIALSDQTGDMTASVAGASPGITVSVPDAAERQALPDGFINAVTVHIPHPRPGRWNAYISNLSGNDDEGYELIVDAAPPAAVVTFITPKASVAATPTVMLGGVVTTTASAFTVNSGCVQGQWCPMGPLVNPVQGTLSLYYTQQRTLQISATTGTTTTVPNDEGTLIASGVPVNGYWTYRWDTSGVAPGTYNVYAVLDDGSGPQDSGYALGTVRVPEPPPLPAPRNVVARSDGRDLHIFWTAPPDAFGLAGYEIQWRTSDMIEGQYYDIDAGEAYTFTLPQAEQGVGYEVRVAAYDQSGQVGETAQARIVRTPAGAGPAIQVAPLRGRVSVGGMTSLPLSLHSSGTASGSTSDYVTLMVGTLPLGLSAQPTVGAVNLFSPPGPGDPNGPTVQVVAADDAVPSQPGHPYHIPIVAREDGTGRTVTATVSLDVTPGPPAQVYMWSGPLVNIGGGMASMTITAKVLDESGEGADTGIPVTFSSSEGMIVTPTVTTAATVSDCLGMPAEFCGPTASVRGGFATTQLVVPINAAAPRLFEGAVIVTADTGSALGNFAYEFPAYAQATRSLDFALYGSQFDPTAPATATHVLATTDRLTIQNHLAAAAHLRLTYWLKVQGQALRERIDDVTVDPLAQATVPLDPAATRARGWDTVEARNEVVGLHITSDLPVIVDRTITQTRSMPGGHHVVRRGFSIGEVEHAQWELTLNRPATGALNDVVSLYNVASQTTVVTVTATAPVTGTPGTATVRATLRLAPNETVALPVDALFARAGYTIAGPITVTATGTRPFVAEAPVPLT